MSSSLQPKNTYATLHCGREFGDVTKGLDLEKENYAWISE